MPVRTGGRAATKEPKMRWRAVPKTLPPLYQARYALPGGGEVRAEKVQMADGWWWRVRVPQTRTTWTRGLGGLEKAWATATRPK